MRRYGRITGWGKPVQARAERRVEHAGHRPRAATGRDDGGDDAALSLATTYQT